MSFITYAIGDDNSRREIDRHEREDYARADLRSWKFSNMLSSFVLVDSTTNKDIMSYLFTKGE